MARAFSYPAIPKLAVGESVVVHAPASEVKRKLTLFGARNKRRFAIVTGGVVEGSHVTRLPDPEPQP